MTLDSAALYDDCHFNEGGARQVAEAVAERFLSQGPLADPARAEALRAKRDEKVGAEALVAEAKKLLETEHEPIQAASALRRALALEPGHAEAARLLAVALGQAGVAAAPPPDPDGETMKAGLAALYTSRDYPAAIAAFQQVLGRTPGHYGATYQLAVALDRAGKGEEAKAQWARVLKLGEQYADEKVIAEARARLGRPDGK
ncbi:MAG: tetratricopeptide repeat protein [Byssovorax sp.]